VVVEVSVVPVVPLVPEVLVPEVVPDVSVFAGFGFGGVPVGGLPGRGGSRLVAVATPPPVFGATAVEVVAVVLGLSGAPAGFTAVGAGEAAGAPLSDVVLTAVSDVSTAGGALDVVSTVIVVAVDWV
jgi:hypothetical protein